MNGLLVVGSPTIWRGQASVPAATETGTATAEFSLKLNGRVYLHRASKSKLVTKRPVLDAVLETVRREVQSWSAKS